MIHSTSTTSLKLVKSVKEYLCFQIEGKSAHAAQCDKSRALTKVINLTVGIESFEEQYVILKGLSQSYKLKQNMVNIVIYQSLSNSTMCGHRFLENINKLYKSDENFDDQ